MKKIVTALAVCFMFLSISYIPQIGKNSETIYDITINEGSLNGLYVDWHANSQKLSEGFYQDGKKEGLWTYWDKNGKVTKEHYKAGELVE